MDDKRFEELMSEYVSAHVQDRERILGKANMSEVPGTEKRRKPIPRYAWAVCACALVIIVSLSVFLPLHFAKRNNTDSSQDFFFAQDSDIWYIEFENPEEMWAQVGWQVPDLETESLLVVYEAIVERNDFSHILGTSIHYEIMDDTTDFINITTYKYNVVMPAFDGSGWDDCFTVKDTIVKYRDYSGHGRYWYEMYFERGNLKYHIRAEGIAPFEYREIAEQLIR